MIYRVDEVAADVTWELRRAVLRPHEDLAHLALVDDDAPGTASFAAFAEDGTVVGTARIAPSDPPGGLSHLAAGATPTWRLRGMATHPDHRQSGVGRQVLARVIAHAAAHGGGLLWCNARIPAVGFYRRAGLVEHGATFEVPEIGPHVVMWRIVDASAPARREV